MTPAGGSSEALPAYVAWIIDAYVRLPHTQGRVRSQDRQLAALLHQRGVTIDIVEAAFLLAILRRTHRPADALPLPPIRSLHYFLPVIEELLHHPPSASYLRYLRRKMAELADQSVAGDCPKKDVFT